MMVLIVNETLQFQNAFYTKHCHFFSKLYDFAFKAPQIFSAENIRILDYKDLENITNLGLSIANISLNNYALTINTETKIRPLKLYTQLRLDEYLLI